MNAALNAYQRSVILSATPTQLLNMLFDRLLLDLSRAKVAQESEQWQAASEQLVHAQDIVAELQSSLNMDAWDGANGLYGIYDYVARALVNANVSRDVKKTAECIDLLEPIRESFRDASASLPAAHQHGGAGIA